jgi:hypothetical protein
MKLKDKYYGSMQEAKDKTPLLTQKIRGKDLNLDGAMNKLVWGGKAKLPKVKEEKINDHDKEETIVAKNEQPNKAKKKRKKKNTGAAAEERERESKKLMLQSLAAGVTIGAAAVAATVLVGFSKPK